MSYQPPVHFTVSQIRTAASCPRILYFDLLHTRVRNLQSPRVTRIWESSGDGAQVTAAGSLFHVSVEKFNRLAGEANEIHELLTRGESSTQLQQGFLRFYNLNCLNRATLAAKSGDTIRAFTTCVHNYMQELADIVVYALSNGFDVADILGQLFGDRRKQVDVTFHVGPNEEPVHITGRLDYVFYDWRVKNHRILDYKLTPSDHPNNDLFQVVTYALMHHHQHQTKPDVAVFYLHPKRRLVEMPWSQVFAQRYRVYDLLASMAQWARFDPSNGTGFRPPGDITYCPTCPWDRDGYCQAQLGAKSLGERLAGWSQQADAGKPAEPVVEVAQLPNESEPPETEADASDGDLSALADDASMTDDADLMPLAAMEAATADEPLDGQGLVIGHCNGEYIRIAPQVLNTHVAVVGAAGSGKTWMAKVIVEEAVRNGVPVVAVDPQGDLVQFLRRSSIEELEPELGGLYDTFRETVETRVFTPGSSHARRISLTPLRLPTPDELSHIDRPERRAEELENILSSTASNLVGLADIGGETDSQKTLLYKLLQQMNTQPTGDIDLRQVVAAVMAPDSMGIDDADMILKKSEREKLARKLYNFIEGPAASLFNKGVPLDLGKLTQPSHEGKIPLNVIYLNAMTDDQEKHFFVAMLASEIYRWMVTSLSSRGRPNLLFYIDEARDYIPAGARKPPAKDPLIRLFTQGRKYGVGCLLCTQSPRSVDYNVFGNCSTKIIGRLEAAQDVDRVCEWFTTDGPAPSWIAQRKGAEKGTFVARWPQMPARWEGKTLRSRKLFSLHEGAWSPDRVEREMELE